MGIAYVNGQVTSLAARAVLLLTVLLGGCATSTAGSSLIDARPGAPAPPKTSGYLSVEDLPPSRTIMTANEQSKLKKELIDALNRQAASVKVQGGTAHAKPMKPRAVQPPNQAVRQ